MKDFIDKYKNHSLPIDIESIVSRVGLNIDYFNFDKINGFISGGTIVINSSLSLAEQRFTLAHELGHYIDGEIGASSGIFACKELKEKKADEFAMNLLCPTKQFIELWEDYQNIPTLAQCLVVPESLVIKKLKHIYG